MQRFYRCKWIVVYMLHHNCIRCLQLFVLEFGGILWNSILEFGYCLGCYELFILYNGLWILINYCLVLYKFLNPS